MGQTDGRTPNRLHNETEYCIGMDGQDQHNVTQSYLKTDQENFRFLKTF